MDERPSWEIWFPLNRHVNTKISSFWIISGIYIAVAVIIGIVLGITGNSVPIVALVIGVLSMPVLFYVIVGIILALVTYKKACKRREERIRMRQEYQREMAERNAQIRKQNGSGRGE